MKGKKKAQIGVEALVSIGVVLFLFLGVLSIYEWKKADIERAEQELKEREECLHIATLTSTIFVLGKNAEIITEVTYPMTIQTSSQRIETEHSFCTLAIKPLSENASSNDLNLVPGTVEIKNTEGEIRIKNV